MNNKGQVLVIFLLLIPVLFLMFASAIDIGIVMTKTYKVKKVIKESINYGLKDYDIEGVKLLLNKNEVGEYIVTSNGNIEISVKGNVKTMFTKKEYPYSYKYLGYMDNGDVKIIEE